MLIVLRKYEKYNLFSYLIIFVTVFLVSLTEGGYEAEDMPPEIVQGARLYPYISDPVERYFWLNSRERMLELSEFGQSILLSEVEAGDTLLIQMSSGGAILSIGSDLLSVETPLIAMPSFFYSMGRTERMLPDWPENRLVEVFTVITDENSIENGTVRITHHSGPSIYMDRIDILKVRDLQ